MAGVRRRVVTWLKGLLMPWVTGASWWLAKSYQLHSLSRPMVTSVLVAAGMKRVRSPLARVIWTSLRLSSRSEEKAVLPPRVKEVEMRSRGGWLMSIGPLGAGAALGLKRSGFACAKTVVAINRG